MLEKLAQNEYSRIVSRLRALADNPRPVGYKKLKGRTGYRIRIGAYRIVYEIEDGQLIILVIDIGHRKDIYN
ncbi:type II toxin-antitoxin system RelE family toxin [Arsenicibacter rosenii]|uniref:type II toxin-antitoxin system RelE family toxin n=1 Tax=Arsenicibacter rosenii TaxID=1750698 RepID=UPI001C430C51